MDVAATPDGAFVYATNFGGHNVSVIDTSTNAVIATVTVGTGPFGIDILSASESTLFLSGSIGENIFLTQTVFFSEIFWSAPNEQHGRFPL